VKIRVLVGAEGDHDLKTIFIRENILQKIIFVSVKKFSTFQTPRNT